MTTTDKNGNLAIAVCPDCNSHSVCDSAWLGMEGQTLKLPCDNCVDDRGKDHLVIRYAHLEVEMREAWTIIDVLYMDALDHHGESWPRAREWQERNQIFSPHNVQVKS